MYAWNEPDSKPTTVAKTCQASQCAGLHKGNFSWNSQRFRKHANHSNAFVADIFFSQPCSNGCLLWGSLFNHCWSFKSPSQSTGVSNTHAKHARFPSQSVMSRTFPTTHKIVCCGKPYQKISREITFITAYLCFPNFSHLTRCLPISISSMHLTANVYETFWKLTQSKPNHTVWSFHLSFQVLSPHWFKVSILDAYKVALNYDKYRCADIEV